MSETLYALTAGEWQRFRRLMIDYESGNFHSHTPTEWSPNKSSPIETYYGKVIDNIPAATDTQVYVGYVEIWSVDDTLFSESDDPAVPLDLVDQLYKVEAFNILSTSVSGGTKVLIVREPYSGYYVIIGAATGLTWVQVLNTTPTQVLFGRKIADAQLLEGSTILVSETANFTGNDVNAYLVSTGYIANGTQVLSVDDATTITMNDVALASADATAPATVTIANSIITCYQATTMQWFVQPGLNTSVLTPSTGCWWYDVNGFNKQTIIPMPPIGFNVLCQQLDTDVDGVSIYAGGQYFGASGTDAIGNIFIDGVCVNIGASTLTKNGS